MYNRHFRVYLNVFRGNDVEREIAGRMQGVISWETVEEAAESANTVRDLIVYATEEFAGVLVVIDQRTGEVVHTALIRELEQ